MTTNDMNDHQIQMSKTNGKMVLSVLTLICIVPLFLFLAYDVVMAMVSDATNITTVSYPTNDRMTTVQVLDAGGNVTQQWEDVPFGTIRGGPVIFRINAQAFTIHEGQTLRVLLDKQEEQ